MYVITGVSGKTGSSAAEALLQKGLPVRVVVRDAAKGKPWAARGAEVAVADIKDATALTEAFRGATAAWVLNPPAYFSPDMFAEARAVADSVRRAALAARLPKLVVLSSVGAGRDGKLGAIGTLRILEQAFRDLPGTVIMLRAAFFMENWLGMLDAAKEKGILPSLAQPLDKRRPLVSTLDIGRTAAELLQADFAPGAHVIELEGPRAYSVNDSAEAIGKALGKPVKPVAIPEDQWPPLIDSFGFTPKVREAYIEMMQSHNADLFQPEPGVELRHGTVTIEEAAASWITH